MDSDQPNGDVEWATVSRWPKDTDIEKAERERQALKDVIGKIAPDRSEDDRTLALLTIIVAPLAVPKMGREAELKAKLARLKKAMAETTAALNALTVDELRFVRLEHQELFYSLSNALSREYRRARDEGPPKDAPDDQWEAWISQRKPTATAVAKAAFDAFQSLTGRRPTIATPFDGGPAHGPFIELVDAAFHATGVDARPESQARKVLRLWK